MTSHEIPSVRALLARQNSGRSLAGTSACAPSARPTPLGATDVNAQRNVTTSSSVCAPLPRSVSVGSDVQSEPVAPRSARISSGSSRPASPQVDKRHRDDPRYCIEYIKDIIENLFRTEQRAARDASYMATQPELSEKMRMILVDWLVEVHQKFKCRHETLFLAVDIVDRFLACSQATRSSLQLVGVTAMLLAAKYEEIWPPEVKDCVYISANTYTREEVLKMERSICNALQFKLTLPNTYHFLTRLLDVIDADATTRHLSTFYAETSLLSYQQLQFPASLVAASCVYLALLAQGHTDAWTPTLQHYGRYRTNDVTECARRLLEFAHTVATSRYTAVKRKYSSSKFLEIASIALPSL